jgi:hypothetical protein
MSNPIPYIAVFLVLTIIFLISFTWVASVYTKFLYCQTNPKIYCRDDWKCTGTCGPDTLPIPPEMAECYLPSANLTKCTYDKIIGWAKCNKEASANNICACLLKDADNCLKGCPLNLDDAHRNLCCCTGAGCSQSALCTQDTG